MTAARIATLLDDIRSLNEDHYTVAQELRQLALAAGPGVSEEVKYGGILFSATGSPFCGIFAYARHVSLELSHGVALPDPHQRLEGSGKYRRHIKLRRVEDIVASEVGLFIVSAYSQASSDRGN